MPVYPPVDSSVTVINVKLLGPLEDIGIDTVVLTVDSKDTKIGTLTPELCRLFHSDRPVYRVPAHEKGSQLLERGHAVAQRMFPLLYFAPDYHFIWQWLAIGKLIDIKKRHRIDFIHSISNPYCSHIVGLFAKKILGKPWICHLDDYWADNPFEHFSRFRRLNRWLERICFARADAILSASREVLTAAERRYEPEIKRKFAFIPPSYEPRFFPEKVPQPQKYEFLFLGKFYKEYREPYTLFRAIKLIRDEHSGIYSKIHFRLVGSNVTEYRPYAEALGIADSISFEGQIDYLRAMRKLREASVMLHIGGLDDRDPGTYTPLKRKMMREDADLNGRMFEALGAQRLILAITTETGPVPEFTRKYGGITCRNNDPRDIVEKITAIVSRYSVKELNEWRYPINSKVYDAQNVSIQFLNLTESLLPSRSKVMPKRRIPLAQY